MAKNTASPVGRNIRRLRDQIGYTTRELSEIVYGDPQRKGYITNLEKGRGCNYSTLERIAKGLDLESPAIFWTPIEGD